MKRRVSSKDLTPVIVGLLVIVVGSMLWNMQESFISRRRREGLANSQCKNKTDCKENKNCVNGSCV